MKNILKQVTLMSSLLAFALLGGILLLASNAEAEVSGLESYSRVCQKGLVALDHDINSFNVLFGVPLSKKSHKLTAIGYEGVISTTVTYQNKVTLIYATANEKYMVYVLTMGSPKAQKIAGFEVQTEKDIKRLYGTPYKELSDSLVYGCDNVEITFKIKNGRIIVVDIVASDL